jgi:signal transduction histidine kinase
VDWLRPTAGRGARYDLQGRLTPSVTGQCEGDTGTNTPLTGSWGWFYNDLRLRPSADWRAGRVAAVDVMRSIEIITAFLALAGTLYLLVVGAILRRGGPRRGTIGLLLAYVAVSLLWTGLQFLAQIGWPASLSAELATRVSLYGLLLSSLLFFHLTWSFLQLEGTARIWWAVGGIWIAVAVVLNEDWLALSRSSGFGTFLYQPFGFGALVFGWGGFMGGATLLTSKVHRRQLLPLHRNRIKYWLLALGFTTAGAALFFAGQEAVASGLHLLGALSASYVVLSHRLLDMRQMLRQMLSYLLATLLTVALYTGAFVLAQRLFHGPADLAPLLAGATIALVLAVFFSPLLGLSQRLVNLVTAGRTYDLGRTLREYSMSISHIVELEHLAAAVVGLVAQTMDVQRGALFLVRRRGTPEGVRTEDSFFRLEGIRGAGQEMAPGTLSAESPITAYLAGDRQPLTQYDVDLLPRFQDAPPEEKEWLSSLEMDVYVPISVKDDWIGLLALGRKASGDRYFDADLMLLSMLADQTAVALENARLFDDLKVRNVENERLNQELTMANIELARLGQAKSDFIDVASHELRTPLAQVCGYNDLLVDMLRKGDLSAEAGIEMTSYIRQAAARLERVVATMVDVSQIDTETLNLRLSPVLIASVVDRAAKSWKDALAERRQVLTVAGLDDLPPIKADGERLVQAFSCIIQNAIKYTPDGGGIHISGRLIGDPQGMTVEVVVADTGVGISREDLNRIFEKFYRVGDILFHSSGETKFKGGGPGLGLTIARGIVRAHGGFIWAESPGLDEELCPGARFHVLLPVESPADQRRFYPRSDANQA